MYRVSSRLLSLISVLILICFFTNKAQSAKFLFSLSVGPDGTKLKNPGGIVFRGGKFYVADSGNKRLVSFSSNGYPLVAFNPKGVLKLPVDLAFQGETLLWIVDEKLGGLYLVDFENKKVKSYIIKYKGQQIFPKVIQVVKDFIYVLDMQTGEVFKMAYFKKRLKILKVFRPSDPKFKGFIDFRVVQNGFWGLSRLNRKIYRYYKGKWQEYSLKGISMAPVSLDVKFNDVFVLDRYFGKVFVFRLPDFRKIDEFGERGWSAGKFYTPIKVRCLYYNYIGVGDDGNGRVEIFRY